MSESLDQTQFIEQQSLLDQEVEAKPVAPSALPVTPVKKKSPIVWIVLAGGIVSSVVIAAVFLMSTKSGVAPIGPDETQAPQQAPVVTKDLEDARKSIDEYELALPQADPFSNTLPFPPVSFDSNLSPER